MLQMGFNQLPDEGAICREQLPVWLSMCLFSTVPGSLGTPVHDEDETPIVFGSCVTRWSVIPRGGRQSPGRRASPSARFPPAARVINPFMNRRKISAGPEIGGRGIPPASQDCKLRGLTLFAPPRAPRALTQAVVIGALSLVASVVFLPGMALGRTIIVALVGGDFATVSAGVGGALPGDTIAVRAGIYHEAVTFGRSGSAGTGFITLKGDPGAILDGTGLTGQGITISGRSYIRVVGMTVQNFKGTGTPMGIGVDGSSSYIELQHNLIHDIENPSGNAHGIAFYGTAATPMTNLVVDLNEIRNCRLGQSESLVLNGNIDGFVVAGNTIHDNDNIGIDFIGFEATGPAGLDQARNGTCVDNVIYNISSATNPTYGGDRSADGIYVDGGRDIVIERNKVDNCDIGVEVASEHTGKAATNITVRDNFISRGYQGNILMGGYAADRGIAHNVVVVQNTTYQGAGGEIVLQYNCDSVFVKNNVLYASGGQPYVSNGGGNNTHIVLANNLYYGASPISPGSFVDPLARFANPLLTSAVDLHVLPGSPAIDAGIALGTDPGGQPLAGGSDIDGAPRVQGTAIDIGADELGGGILEAELPRPAGSALMLLAPNPVRGTTSVHYFIPSAARVTLQVYDLHGRVIDTPVDQILQAGSHDVSLRAERWPVGCYFLRLATPSAALIRRMLVIR